jgi:hypothetical protein
MLPDLARKPAGRERRHWPLAVQTRRAHQPVMTPGKSKPPPPPPGALSRLGRLRLQAPVSQLGGQPRQGLHHTFSGSAPPVDRPVAPDRACDAGLRPRPFPDQAASLLAGLLVTDRTYTSSDDEITNMKATAALRHGDTSRSAGRTKGQGNLIKIATLNLTSIASLRREIRKSDDDRWEFPISADPFSWLCGRGHAAVRPLARRSRPHRQAAKVIRMLSVAKPDPNGQTTQKIGM